MVDKVLNRAAPSKTGDFGKPSSDVNQRRTEFGVPGILFVYFSVAEHPGIKYSDCPVQVFSRAIADEFASSFVKTPIFVVVFLMHNSVPSGKPTPSASR